MLREKKLVQRKYLEENGEGTICLKQGRKLVVTIATIFQLPHALNISILSFIVRNRYYLNDATITN